jgi:hypothetical protein
MCWQREPRMLNYVSDNCTKIESWTIIPNGENLKKKLQSECIIVNKLFMCRRSCCSSILKYYAFVCQWRNVSQFEYCPIRRLKVVVVFRKVVLLMSCLLNLVTMPSFNDKRMLTEREDVVTKEFINLRDEVSE